MGNTDYFIFLWRIRREIGELTDMLSEWITMRKVMSHEGFIDDHCARAERIVSVGESSALQHPHPHHGKVVRHHKNQSGHWRVLRKFTSVDIERGGNFEIERQRAGKTDRTYARQAFDFVLHATDERDFLCAAPITLRGQTQSSDQRMLGIEAKLDTIQPDE